MGEVICLNLLGRPFGNTHHPSLFKLSLFESGYSKALVQLRVGVATGMNLPSRFYI